MKNNKFKLYSGFTIAELLLSMLVVMVVAAAMVPIIGPKKLKVPNIYKSHGIFECYYNENGVLMQYHANNRGPKDCQPKQSEHEDYCVFNVPAADKYEIFAIGAGSDGYRDPAHVGYTIDNSNFVRNGIIHLNTFKEDIASANMGDSELLGVMSLSEEIIKLFEEWVDDKVSHGSYLYAVFSNIKSPVRRGGAGLAARKISFQNTTGDVRINCETACSQNTINCKGPYPHPDGQYWDARSNVEGLALANDMCYWYIHEGGTDSAMGREMLPGNLLLVPIDANQQSEFFITANDDRMQIKSTIRNGSRFDLHLKAKLAGGDAYQKVLPNGVVQLTHGKDPTENTPQNTPQDTLENTAGAKVGNVILTNDLLDTYFPFSESRRSKGVQFGIEQGDGLKNLGGPENKAKPGEVAYKNDAFKWSYTALGVDYEYGKAGTPGDMQSMTFTKLNGNLYLFPGYTRGENTRDSIVSKTTSIDNPRNYIIHAESRPNELSSVRQLLPLTSSIMPNPNEVIKAAATADNSVFNQYISRINESGFRGGLYKCDVAGFCPGYAGSGAYPFINIADGENILKIIDRQSPSNGERFKKFKINVEANGQAKCEIGEVQYKNVTKHYIGTDGKQHDYKESYCVANDDKRRDGAIVIV